MGIDKGGRMMAGGSKGQLKGGGASQIRQNFRCEGINREGRMVGKTSGAAEF